MPESMLKMKYIVLFGFFYGRLKCSNTDVQYAYMQPVSQDHGRVWLCLAAHCSQDAFSFLIFSLFLPKESDLVVIYFVKHQHVTCSTLKLVMYSWNVEMALQNFVLFPVYPSYAPWDLEQWVNRLALHDAASVRCNVGVHKGATVSSSRQKWVLKAAFEPFDFPIFAWYPNSLADVESASLTGSSNYTHEWDIHAHKRMVVLDFNDPWPFSVLPSSGQSATWEVVPCKANPIVRSCFECI